MTTASNIAHLLFEKTDCIHADGTGLAIASGE